MKHSQEQYTDAGRARRHAAGFSLVELMVAIAISLVVVMALVSMMVQSNRARNEIQLANEQIENGRYALVTLSDDLQLAGYLSHFNIADAGMTIPAAKPDACATALATLRDSMILHVQGYNNTAALSCISDRKANTDVLVIRRVSTCVRDSADCPAIAGAVYFQASTCAPATGGTELSSLDPTEWYRMDTNTANLNRRRKVVGGCANFAPMRQYFTRIYYIADNFQAGDGIPTLMRVDLGVNGGGAVAFGNPIPISSGIENLQFEYGIDASGDGMPDIAPDGFAADPDIFARTGGPYADCAENPDCTRNWRDVMAVKIFLLARNTQGTPGYSDSKTYNMGNGVTVGPFNNGFKRHAYQTVVRLNNPAGRREQ